MTEPLEVTFVGPANFVATDTVTKPVTVTVTCPQGLTAGTDVRISISSFHAYTQAWELDAIDIVGGEGRYVLGHGLPRAWHQMTRGGAAPAGGGLIGRPINEIYLCTIQITQAISPGASIVFALRAGVSPHADVAGELMVKVRPPDAECFEGIGERFPLPNSPGEPVRLEARLVSTAEAEGGYRLVVFATDSLLNPVLNYQATLNLTSSDGTLEGLPAAIETGPDGRATFSGLLGQRTKVVRIQVEDPARGLSTISGPILAKPAGEQNHYFGAIHFHTRLSVDGDREPRQAYAYARDYLNLDVVAMTDHAPIGARWQESLQVNEEFYAPGRFVTLPAWESSNAYGHANLYLRTPDVDGGPWFWNPDVCPSEVKWDDDVIMVPHHPNTGQHFARGEHREMMDKGAYWTKYDWRSPNDRARLVEIVQGRSNFEADALDQDWGIVMGEQGASVQDALREGWRLGFVAGTDNHQGYPTQRNGVYVGMTCFRATELTRESIWQAMNRRQTYATSGVPIVCDYKVNGIDSGDEGGWEDGQPVTFAARLHGTAPIEEVEVISNGRTVWQARPQAWDVELTGEALPPPEGPWAYYYLRLRQADNHRAWLSPVWLLC